MAQPGSSSYLANMAQRRHALMRVREALLDRPGIQPPNPTAPPATVPAQNRVSPQEQALAQQQPAPEGTPGPDLNSREGRLDFISTALESVRQTKEAQLLREHRLVPPPETKEGRRFQTHQFIKLIYPAAKKRFP